MSEQHGVLKSASSSCDIAPCSSTSSTLKIYQAVIFVLPVLFTLILIFLFWLLYLRRRRVAQTSSRLRAQVLARSLVNLPAENGLCKVFRDTLPVTVYDDAFAASIEDRRCSVCLDDFELNEKLRQLPVCGHCFHLDCIDEWIRCNSTCPVCRSTLIVTKQAMAKLSRVHPANGSAQISEADNIACVNDIESNEALFSESIGTSNTNTTPSEVSDGAANV